jgi:hypothetical protein
VGKEHWLEIGHGTYSTLLAIFYAQRILLAKQPHRQQQLVREKVFMREEKDLSMASIPRHIT